MDHVVELIHENELEEGFAANPNLEPVSEG